MTFKSNQRPRGAKKSARIPLEPEGVISPAETAKDAIHAARNALRDMLRSEDVKTILRAYQEKYGIAILSECALTLHSLETWAMSDLQTWAQDRAQVRWNAQRREGK